MPKQDNYYQLLGISIFATDEEIRSGYLKKVKKFHPDTYKGDKEEAENITAEINVAYLTLKDHDKKNIYDKQYGFDKLRLKTLEAHMAKINLDKRSKKRENRRRNNEKSSKKVKNNQNFDKNANDTKFDEQDEQAINELKKTIKSMRKSQLTPEQKKFKKERFTLDIIIISLLIIVILLIVLHK